MNEGDRKKREEIERQKIARNTTLNQLLTQEAMSRISGISLVKPERARNIEDVLLNMARSRQLGGKIDDQMLVGIIERMKAAAPATETPKITIIRKRCDSDEDF